MSKVELTPAKLAELKQKASECDCKIWRIYHKSEGYSIHAGRNIKIADSEFPEDAEFIAAADPATVIALVEEIELLKKRLSWFPAHMKDIIDLAILAHTGGMADPRKDHCSCDHTVGYYCEYCAVLHALISCKNATESEAGQ